MGNPPSGECEYCNTAVVHATLASNGTKIDLLPAAVLGGFYRLSEGPRGWVARKLTPTEKLTTGFGTKAFLKHECPRANIARYRHRRTA